jgi:hypothetical protein
MPSSLSHVVVFTDDLEGLLTFLTDVAKVKGVTRYETVPEQVEPLFGWPLEHGRARCAFVGEGPGAIDVVEIPPGLRDTVRPGVRLLAIPNRDAVAAQAQAAGGGYEARGPFTATTSTGGEMHMTEVVAGGVAFELVQFG